MFKDDNFKRTGFNASKPTGLKPLDGSKKYPEDKIVPKQRVDIKTIGSVQEALDLLEAGKIDQIDWEDWIDMVTGQSTN